MSSLTRSSHIARLLVFLIAGACSVDAATRTSALGQTLALQDDAGVVTVAWDTRIARVYRDGREVAANEAPTFEAALWSVDIPSYGTARSPHRYDRLLSAAEIRELSRCSWPATAETTRCGLDASCDCGTSSDGASLASMF